MDNKHLLVASIILSLGIIIGCLLLSFKPVSYIYEAKNEMEAENKELIDINEASEFLGVTTDDIEEIIKAEETYYDTHGSIDDGKGLPYIVINKSYFFEKISLVMWVKDSDKYKRIYNDGELLHNRAY